MKLSHEANDAGREIVALVEQATGQSLRMEVCNQIIVAVQTAMNAAAPDAEDSARLDRIESHVDRGGVSIEANEDGATVLRLRDRTVFGCDLRDAIDDVPTDDEIGSAIDALAPTVEDDTRHP